MALSSVIAPLFQDSSFGPLFKKLRDQAHDVVLANWHLGITAFGGPPVHFQIFHKKFVDELQWIDEQTYQELFAIASSLPGPASTKMLFNINVIHGGFLNGVLSFLIWSLPGAVGMFCFSLGVSRIGDTLPEAVYALLSGLNAATVGIVALAAVQLSQKVITDKWTRALVFLGGAAGMLHTALWYFPVLMAVAGIATTIWDLKLVQKLARALKPRNRAARATELEENRSRSDVHHPPRASNASHTTNLQPDGASATGSSHLHPSRQISSIRSTTPSIRETPSTPLPTPTATPSLGAPLPPPSTQPLLTWQTGTLILLIFSASFLTIMLIRGLYPSPARPFSVFANLYLAGTIIFGGGPVVIPLLREYVVAEGWVSPRDFLLGLALIQAFPGPNFNFAVYLGALAISSGANGDGGSRGGSRVVGAIVAFVGIFLPGLLVQAGFMGLWGSVRKSRGLLSALRGVNAAAVGLVFTAVYRFWQIGYLDQKNQAGQPLGGSPWWVVVTATSFVGGTWFGLNPPSAVVLGGTMGLLWYGVVKA